MANAKHTRPKSGRVHRSRTRRKPMTAAELADQLIALLLPLLNKVLAQIDAVLTAHRARKEGLDHE